MKKHILSNYLKEVKSFLSNRNDVSVVTESIETSDPDEFRLNNVFSTKYGPDSTLTHSIETSDPDEFRIDNTQETRALETSDPDEFRILDTTVKTRFIEISNSNEFYDDTKTTFSTEQSDPDEFRLNPIVSF